MKAIFEPSGDHAGSEFWIAEAALCLGGSSVAEQIAVRNKRMARQVRKSWNMRLPAGFGQPAFANVCGSG
jgi:hypothetical protein